jgi:hypothetical protein
MPRGNAPLKLTEHRYTPWVPLHRKLYGPNRGNATKSVGGML